MRILYINYVDTDVLNSGSAVRPFKMLEAFKATGHEVLELTGNQISLDRKYRVALMTQLVDSKRPDICYIESPTAPIFRKCDRELIFKLKRMGVPVGFFLRDFYNMFRDELPRRHSSIVKYLKDVYWDHLLPKTLDVLNDCSIVYLPSDECKNLFAYRDMRSLPPAGDEGLWNMAKYSHTCIYVGGWGGNYDNFFLVDAFNNLYKRDSSYRLIVVCRENDWEKFESPYKDAEWLEIHHVSGEGLVPLYQRASVGLMIPNIEFQYSKIAVSVKMFEYTACGIPVVSIDTPAMGCIIRDNQLGQTIKRDIDEFANAVIELTSDENHWKKYHENVVNSLLHKHLWKHRVKQVINELSEYIPK